VREDKIHATYNCKYPTIPSASIYTFGIQRPAIYLIHGQDASGQPYGKYSSTDIQKWSTIYDASNSKPSRIYWDGKKWITTTENSHTTQSYNGTKFTTHSTPASLRAVKQNPITKKYLALGSGGIYSSYDSRHWSLASTILTNDNGYQQGNLHYNGSLWVAAGYNNSTATSLVYSEDDGQTWISGGNAIFDPSHGAFDVIWNGSLWVAAGGNHSNDNVIATSTTGKSWTLQSLPSNVIKKNYIDFLTDKPMTLEWDGTAFILSLNKQVTMNYNFLYSYDAITWQTQQAHLITSANITKYMGATTVIAGEDTTNSLILKRNGNYNNFRVPRIANTKQIYDIELNQEYANQIIFSRNYSYAISTDHQSLYQSVDYGATWSRDLSSNLLSILSTSIRYIDYNNQDNIWVAVGQGTTDTIAVRRETEVANADRYEWIGRGNHCLIGEGKKVKWSYGLKHWLAISNTNICLSKDGYYWLPVHSYPTVKDFDTNGKMCTIVLGTDGICFGTSPTSFTTYTIAEINGLTGGMNSVEQVLWSGTQWIFLLKNTSTNLTNIYIASKTNMRDFTLVANDEVTVTKIQRANSHLFLISPTEVYKSYHGYTPTPYTVLLDVSGTTSINYNGSYYTFYLSNAPSKNTWDFINYTTDGSYNMEMIVHNEPTISRIEIDPILLAGGESASSTIQYSYDGYQWLSATSAVLSTRTNTFSWNGIIWVAGGINTSTGSWTAYSSDGILWTETVNTILSECYEIEWNGERFMATGIPTISGSAPIAYSTNGKQWTQPSIINPVISAGYSIKWNGTNWILYGNSSYIYVSTDSLGSNWTPVALSLNDLSLCMITGITASTDNTNAYVNLTDGSMNTYWLTTNSGYDASGNYVGISGIQGVSGENLIATLSAATIVKAYELAFSTTDTEIPQKYRLLGSTNGSNWTEIDNFTASTNTISPQIDNKYVRIHEMLNQTIAYEYYAIVFEKTNGSSNIRLREWKLYNVSDSSRIVSAREKLLMNHRGFFRNYKTPTEYNVAHYNRTMSLASDHYVSNQLMNRINTENTKTMTSLTQTDKNMYMLTDISGGVYISYDSSACIYDRQTIGQTGLYSSCYYGGHLYVGGTGGIQYSHPTACTTWYSPDEQPLSTVYALKTNQKMGYIISPNTICLREKDTITLTTPKSYTDSMQHSSGMNTSIEYIE